MWFASVCRIDPTCSNACAKVRFSNPAANSVRKAASTTWVTPRGVFMTTAEDDPPRTGHSVSTTMDTRENEREPGDVLEEPVDTGARTFLGRGGLSTDETAPEFPPHPGGRARDLLDGSVEQKGRSGERRSTGSGETEVLPGIDRGPFHGASTRAENSSSVIGIQWPSLTNSSESSRVGASSPFRRWHLEPSSR